LREKERLQKIAEREQKKQELLKKIEESRAKGEAVIYVDGARNN